MDGLPVPVQIVADCFSWRVPQEASPNTFPNDRSSLQPLVLGAAALPFLLWQAQIAHKHYTVKKTLAEDSNRPKGSGSQLQTLSLRSLAKASPSALNRIRRRMQHFRCPPDWSFLRLFSTHLQGSLGVFCTHTEKLLSNFMSLLDRLPLVLFLPEK